MLSKSDRERQIPQDFLISEKNEVSEQTKQKQTHRYRTQTYGHQMGGSGGWAKEWAVITKYKLPVIPTAIGV